MGVMGVKFAGDPLTCSLWALMRDIDTPEFGCNCPRGAGNFIVYGVDHSETCSITPIYAELVRKYPDVHPRLWLDMSMDLKHTVIKCAECGREKYAREMDVIYRPLPWETLHPTTKDILKAVCPQHNRHGRIGGAFGVGLT